MSEREREMDGLGIKERYSDIYSGRYSGRYSDTSIVQKRANISSTDSSICIHTHDQPASLRSCFVSQKIPKYQNNKTDFTTKPPRHRILKYHLHTPPPQSPTHPYMHLQK